MGETGVVVGVQGEQALVELEASKECESCGACLYTETGRMVAPIANSLKAGVGDVVRISIEPKLVLAAAFIVYMMPIIFFFLGYGVSMWLGRVLNQAPETFGMVGGGLFLIASFVLVRHLDKRAKITRRFEPKMYAIIRKN
jgi:sigma-E factor negative regulatory protein RseC